MKYAEDIINITVAETEILTIGNAEPLEHFIYVSDYNSSEPFVAIVCENEADALLYLKLLARSPKLNFSIRRSVDTEWEAFETEVAKLGLTCRYGYDMVYANNSVSVPEYDGLSIRSLTAEDMPMIKTFKQNGGCAECHIRAIQIYFGGKGNAGMNPIGIFANGELICLAMPTLDRVRELKKYDIGAIFTINTNKKVEAIDLMWKYVIDKCLKDNAAISNSNAAEDDTPLGVSVCECVGLVKVAKNCSYRK